MGSHRLMAENSEGGCRKLVLKALEEGKADPPTMEADPRIYVGEQRVRMGLSPSLRE